MRKPVSFIISAASENENLERFLKHHLPLLGEDDEIIIALAPDNYSTERLLSIDKRVLFIQNTSRYAPHGFNLSLAASKNRFIILCGVRSFIGPEYIDQSVKLLTNNNEIGCVGGTIIHKGKTSSGKAIALAMGAVFGMGVFSFRSKKKSGFVDSVSTPVFRKKIFDEIGLFDESLVRNQDDELSYRLLKNGYKIWHENSVFSEYYVREKFSQLWSQFFQYGFWKNQVNKKHKTITTLRQLAPPIFVIMMLLLPFFNTKLWVVISIIYLAAIFIQSVLINKMAAGYIFKTFFAFLVMHSAYGTGYINGLISTIILNRKAPESVKKISR